MPLKDWWTGLNLLERSAIVVVCIGSVCFFPVLGFLAVGLFALNLIFSNDRSRSRRYTEIMQSLASGELLNDADWLALQNDTISLNFSSAKRNQLYQAALAALQKRPTSGAKTYCLTIGRWFMGNSRPKNRVTMYDEQAIQNDILVRSR